MGQERQQSFRTIYQRCAVLNASKYSHYTKNNEHRSQLPRCLKAWVSGRWLEGNAGSNPAGGMAVWSLVSVVCCQERVSAMANHSSRGVLPCVVCLTKCDLEKFQQWGGLGKIGLLSHKKDWKQTRFNWRIIHIVLIHHRFEDHQLSFTSVTPSYQIRILATNWLDLW
jgi:hypothetical protein